MLQCHRTRSSADTGVSRKFRRHGATLQCHRTRSSADTTPKRISLIRDRKLQCHRTRSSADTVAISWEARFGTLLQCHRTRSSADTFFPIFLGIGGNPASMSPHPFECGYMESDDGTTDQDELQCHRTRSSADTSVVRENIGRGPSFNVTAPVRVRIPRPRRRSPGRLSLRFNVTAPVRVRIPTVWPSFSGWSSGLQCHRTRSSADTERTRLVYRWPESLQCHRTRSSADTRKLLA